MDPGLPRDELDSDAEGFFWNMRDPLSDGRQGYARWRFGYKSRLPESAGREVAFEGMSRFAIEDGLIRRYEEVFDAGIAFVQLGMPAERIAKILDRLARRMNESTES